MGCVLEKSVTDEAECSRKVTSERRVAGTIRSLVNARNLQLECARVLHESLLVPVLTCGSEKMIWREKERSRIRAVQMDNLRRIDKVTNTRIRHMCGMSQGVDEKIDEGVLRWFRHVERIENDRIAEEID